MRKRIFAALLCLCMVVTLLPTAAYANAFSGILPRNGTLDLQSEALSYRSTDGATKTVNMNTTSVTDCAEGWSWDYTTHTLTLSGARITGTENVERGAAIRIRDDVSTTITLEPRTTSYLKGKTGDSETLFSTAIFGGGQYSADKGLNINGGGSMLLETSPVTTGAKNAIISAINLVGTIKISGNADITIQNAAAESESRIAESHGIVSSGIEICEKAKVNIIAGSATADEGSNSLAESFGLKCTFGSNTIWIIDDAIVRTTGGTVTNSDDNNTPGFSAGIKTQFLNIQGNARVTSIGNTQCAGKVGSYGIWLSSSNNSDEKKLTVVGDASVIASGTNYGIIGRVDTAYNDSIGISNNAKVVALALGTQTDDSAISSKVHISGGCLTASSPNAAFTAGSLPLTFAMGLQYTVKAGIDERTASSNPITSKSKYVQIKTTGYNDLTPDLAEFDKNTDTTGLSFALKPDSENKLLSVNNGEEKLEAGNDYTVEGNTYTILPGYLQEQPVETLVLTFKMNSGSNPAALIAVRDSRPVYVLTVNLDGGNGGTKGGFYAGNDRININAGTKAGYTFNGWTSSRGGTFDDAGSASTTFTMPEEATAVTANWTYNGGSFGHSSETAYLAAEGAGGIWTKGSSSGYSFTVDSPLSKFKSVQVDGITVDESNYDKREGSTVITLHADYLATLSAGQHTLRVNFTDGYAQTTFTVAGENEINPNTGYTGNTALWALSFLLSGCAISVLIAAEKRLASNSFLARLRLPRRI